MRFAGKPRVIARLTYNVSFFSTGVSQIGWLPLWTSGRWRLESGSGLSAVSGPTGTRGSLDGLADQLLLSISVPTLCARLRALISGSMALLPLP